MGRKEHRDAARAQRVCAVSGRAGPFHPHHVVRVQDVRDGDPHDTRNALRLAVKVHFNHHHKVERVPMSVLTDENVEYAFELFGPYAADYLARNYGGTDTRVSARLQSADG